MEHLGDIKNYLSTGREEMAIISDSWYYFAVDFYVPEKTQKILYNDIYSVQFSFAYKFKNIVGFFQKVILFFKIRPYFTTSDQFTPQIEL